jgi:DNA repair protein RadC
VRLVSGGAIARQLTLLEPAVTLATRYRLTLTREPGAETGEPPPLTAPAKVVDYLWRTFFHDEPRELCVVLFVGGDNEGIGHMVAAAGTRSHCAIDPYSVLAAALLCLADGFILAHNHPRGRTEPSPEDLLFTRQLAAAARAVRLHLVDHLIVAGPKAWYSLRQWGHVR